MKGIKRNNERRRKIEWNKERKNESVIEERMYHRKKM